MPPVRPTHIVSFSSEDPNHPASNLLKGETFRKWKCKEPGEDSAYVILQLEKAVQITSIDIGNEHSANVEVLVGRSGQVPQNFEVLLSQCAFMHAKESRESTNTNRVRMFGPDKLDKTISSQKWDLVKVVCVQRFNTHVQFGLSFININAALDPNEKPKIGGFSLRPSLGEEESSDSVRIGGLFAKRLHDKDGTSSPVSIAPTTPSFAIRQASASIASIAIASSDERVKELRKHKLGPDADDTDVKIGRSQSPLSRSVSPTPRNSSWYGTSPISSKNTNAQDPKASQGQTPTSTKSAPVPQASKVSTTPTGSVHNKPSGNTVKKLPSKPKPKTKSKRRTKPFSKLFEGVVFVMSGFVNPYRATLRSKAVQMGARCKNDWDRTCTHLICAFVNTPKFREVRQSGHGKIVKKEWIEESYSAQCRFPWRRFCLDRNDQGSDSEEEIFLETDDGADNNMEEDEEEENPNLPQSSPKKDSDSEGEGFTSKSKSTPKRETASKSKLSSRAEESDEGEKDEDEEVGVKSKSPKRRRILEIQSSDEEEDEAAGSSASKTTTIQKRDSPPSNTNVASTNNVNGSGGEDSGDIYDADTDVEDDGGSSPSMLADVRSCNQDNFFEDKVFYFHGSEEGLTAEMRNIARLILLHKGEIEASQTARVEYVLTDGVQWEEDFSEAMAENPNLTFVQSKWIVECEEKNEMIPPDPFMILPN